MTALPLAGKSVAVTRAKHQSKALTGLLQARGASVVEVPTVAIGDPDDWAAVDEAITRVDSYDAVLMTSRNGAERFFARARDVVGASLEGVTFGAVGRKTGEWLGEATGHAPPLVPGTFRGEAFAERIVEQLGPDLTGRAFLIPQAAEARGKLGEDLRAKGASVDEVVVYRIGRGPPVTDAQMEALRQVDVITFMSGQTLTCFLSNMSEADARAILARATVAVIGPVARQTAAGLGVRVDVVPDEATIDSLVDALVTAVA